MQQIQDLIVKATANIVKLTHKTAATQDSEDFDRVTDAIALLGQANKQINLRRKELHKSDLDPKYHYLASASFPFTEYLYGEDTDVNKNIKDINDLNKIGRSMGRGYQRGSFRVAVLIPTTMVEGESFEVEVSSLFTRLRQKT